MLVRVVALLAIAAAAEPDRLVPGALHGEIDVVSFGVGRLSADRGAAIAVVHVRQTFHNRGDAPWIIDATDARVWLGGTTAVAHPLAANSDAATLPLLIVSRGEHRIVDLYFPIATRSDDDLPYFSLTYPIHSGARRYEANVMLAQTNHWPTRDERGREPGWGRRWWADPTYSWSRYRHRPGYVVPRVPTTIEVISIPRGYYEEVPAMPIDVAIF